MSLTTVWAIAVKDLRQFLRDRALLFFMLMLPVMQLLLLAQATARGINDVPIAVLDYDRSSESRALIALLSASERFAVSMYPQTWEEGERAIELGDVYAMMIIPDDMTSTLYAPSETATLQIIVDSTNAIMGRVIEGGAREVMQRFSEQHITTSVGGVRVAPVMLYNPSVQGRPYTISAQLGFITYQVTLAVAALSLAREREIGTLEQLMVTPVRRFELLLGKALPPTLVGLADFLVLTLVIRYVFGIVIQGAFWFLVLGSLIFIFAEVIWGTLVSSVAGTQQQAILLVFIQAMVDVALSGYLVPVRDMPRVFGFFARFVPLHYYLIFVRSVVLKGAGLMDMWQQLAALAGLSIMMGFVTSFTVSRNLA